MVLRNFRARDFEQNGDENVKMVRSKRDVYDVDAPKQEASTPIVSAENPDAVPAGTVKEILTWVGEDPERAQKALDEETANEKPRKGLVESLSELIDAEAEEEVAAPEEEVTEEAAPEDEEKSE